MNKPQINEDLRNKFFSDPDWSKVENIILDYIEPLTDMSTVDTNQTAETVKAEIIGRSLAYKSLYKFLQDSQIVSSPRLKTLKNPFR